MIITEKMAQKAFDEVAEMRLILGLQNKPNAECPRLVKDREEAYRSGVSRRSFSESDEARCSGLYFTKHNIIWVDTRNRYEWETKETLWHEMCHAHQARGKEDPYDSVMESNISYREKPSEKEAFAISRIMVIADVLRIRYGINLEHHEYQKLYTSYKKMYFDAHGVRLPTCIRKLVNKKKREKGFSRPSSRYLSFDRYFKDDEK